MSLSFINVEEREDLVHTLIACEHWAFGPFLYPIQEIDLNNLHDSLCDLRHQSLVSRVRSGQSVQTDVITNAQTPFYLRLKGPAEVYASAVVTQ